MRILSKLILIFCLVGFTVQAQNKVFKIEDGDFKYNGESIHIYAGEMHYARIPKEYWRHRLQMMKALGLNAVNTYVFWNYHNTAPGEWDWKSDNKNLTEFIKLAEEEGLFVILRPGPYACAEWEFGGYPWWLQKNPDLKIRQNNEAFLDSCRTYINELAAQVKPLQASEGGNLIMVQAENEFGSFVSQREDISAEDHKAYKQKIFEMLKDSGLDGPFFTSDGTWLFSGGALEGVLPTANGENNIANLKKAVNEYHNGEGPYMVAEFYPGWLDHWAEPFTRISADAIAKQTEVYLKNDVDFNIYMVHGGTNFGFTSGANYNDDHDIQPDITSYDYDAPISEAGWATPKYMAIRKLMKEYVEYDIPEIPAQIPVIAIPEIKLDKKQSAIKYIKSSKPVIADAPMSFEELDQGFGYVLYRKKFTQPINGKLQIPGLRDYATIYVNGKYVGKLNRIYNEYEMDIKIPFNGTLEILVENMGRINYGAKITENTKGIISAVSINDYEISGGWEMYKAPFDVAPNLEESTEVKEGLPVLYSGSFDLDKVGDTFLDMQKWGKGIVFVNGHNLGRYWKVGPQQTLYLPGCWLKEKGNTITILEQLNEDPKSSISGLEQPILDSLSQ
ncbi:beta-galactosidase [Zunongwangia atlantica]|uniref:Beta-galactosidase n=1 Tax=Zunongwangia atlantica 22II14-10F7 TaxID=1185767 RepID=A0A1Y1T7J5_9FLAO|nr:beta-galactosidase [Zunongwangia atlantica]ORL46692.1 beta-galactosidase [Zunongwangia atlantica 22II14-10F7]